MPPSLPPQNRSAGAEGSADAEQSVKQSPEEQEYRSRCRRFYRKATSVVSDDDDDSNTNDDDEERGHDLPRNNAIVLQAVDHLSIMEPDNTTDYRSFLQELDPQQRLILRKCGLPDTERAIASTDWSQKLQRLVATRTEARKDAHEVNMTERINILLKILNETIQKKKGSTEVRQSNDRTDKKTIATTRSHIRGIHQTLRHFVQAYSENVATHSLLAGMRHCIQSQLDQAEPHCVVWTFDAAVISEAVVAHQRGGSDQYMRDAIEALLSFLVCLPSPFDGDEKKNSIEDATNIPIVQLRFAMDPSLSDRTLTCIQQGLSRPAELHGRPTGQFDFPQPGSQILLVRTNVEGEADEPMNDCSEFLARLMGWY